MIEVFAVGAVRGGGLLRLAWKGPECALNIDDGHG